MKSCTKYDLDLDIWPWPWKVHPRSKFLKHIKEILPKYAWILCTGHNLLLVSKVKVKVKFTELAITSHLIVIETSNLVHISVYEKLHQIWPWPSTLSLTLKSSPKVKIFENLSNYAWILCTGYNLLLHQRSRSRSSKRSNSLNWL